VQSIDAQSAQALGSNRGADGSGPGVVVCELESPHAGAFDGRIIHGCVVECDVPQEDILHRRAGAADQQDATVGFRIKLTDRYISDMTRLITGRAAAGLDMNWPCEHERHARVTDDVGDGNILEGFSMEGVNADGTMAVTNYAVTERDVANVLKALDAAQFQTDTMRTDDAITHGYVFAGSSQWKSFEADGIVAGIDVAIADSNPAAAGHVDAIAVGRIVRVMNFDSTNDDNVGLGQMKGPEADVSDGNVRDDYVSASLDLHRSAHAARIGISARPGE